MIVFRHADPRYPFLWESSDQPPGRWHGPGEGPVHYFSDTPDGAWAEFIRHEEIRDTEDLAGIQRTIWAVEIREEPEREPTLPYETLTGGPETYEACRDEARQLREAGATKLVTPSAALLPGAARGWQVDGGLRPGSDRDGQVIVLFGYRQDLTGWSTAIDGRPDERLLEYVRYFDR